MRRTAGRAEPLSLRSNALVPHSSQSALQEEKERSARLEALSYIADRLEANCPASPPPLDPSVAALAETAFGYSSDEG